MDNLPTDAPPAPSFTVTGDQVDILPEQPFKIGDVVTAQLRVSSVSDGDSGQSTGFEVVSIEPSLAGPTEIEGEGAPLPSPDEVLGEEDDADESGEGAEPDDEEKMLGFKRPKVKRDVPKLSAKDLQDY